MKLSDGEKLILMMLSEIYEHHKIKGEIDPAFVQETLTSGQIWGFPWKYSGLGLEGKTVPPVVKETCDIFDMYSLVSSSYDKLAPSEKKKVRDGADPFDDYVVFQGFDFNNDDHAGVASYLVNHLGRYTNIDPSINSHNSTTIHKYRKMLSIYKDITDPYPAEGLSADQLIAILKS